MTTTPPSSIISDTLLLSVLSTSTLARNQALQLSDFIANLPPNTPLSPADGLEVSKQQKLLYGYLAKLRGGHRDMIHSGRDTRAETLVARQEVDTLHLQLQNLYYEQRHLQGEIDACESYEYAHLPLIPTEQLIALKPELANADEIELTVAQIEHEHAEREALEQQRQGLLKRKQGLISEVKRRKEELEGLDSMLEGFLKGAEPILKVLESGGGV